ncbi:MULTISPECIES: hypothetical protein [Bacillus cereus group]|uniref:hypothetical protein n=1 Tax=Bacillus cereus group TaxID=86661 RepID=UPI000BF71997|nr:hypothetical protein [Bacillus cereus]PFA10639.1 hypothetical protein CN382_20235 [Bacillus cereus]PFM41232.1 hypothetical protein COJ43_09090 [Bacillus cereus]PGL64901.1 hypothetical protein CN927_03195 [Bacillus cereus]
MTKYNYFTYALMNTIIFLPYFLFIIIGNSYNTLLNGWFPLIIFYTFKYTGTFLIHSFKTKLNTREQLLNFLIVAIIGTICGSLASFSTIWLEISALFMGIASSILLPLYTTTQYHEKLLFGRKMKRNQYLFALLTVILILPLILFTANSNHASLAFIFYGIALYICYVSLRKMPTYEVTVENSFHFSVPSFLLFILFTTLLFLMKATREINLQLLLVLLVVTILVAIALLTIYITKVKFQLQLPKFIYYFGFTQGMIVNFYLLYGTFFALSQKNSTFMIYGVYLPYGIGIILSLFLGSKLSHHFNSYHPITVTNVGALLGILCTMLSWTLPIGGLLVGFFSSLQARQLNRFAYDATSSLKDSSLSLRNRWSKLGSMINQILLITFILVLSFIYRIPLNEVFVALTGKGIQNELPMFPVLITVNIVICFIIGSLLIFGSWKLEKTKR